jgi:hypothetical protein
VTYCLGHIHKRQSWGNVFLFRQHHEAELWEQEEKGFYVHEIKHNVLTTGHVPFWQNLASSKRPARSMRTKRPLKASGVEVVEDVQTGRPCQDRLRVAEADIGKVDEQASSTRPWQRAPRRSRSRSISSPRSASGPRVSAAWAVREKL